MKYSFFALCALFLSFACTAQTGANVKSAGTAKNADTAQGTRMKIEDITEKTAIESVISDADFFRGEGLSSLRIRAIGAERRSALCVLRGTAISTPQRRSKSSATLKRKPFEASRSFSIFTRRMKNGAIRGSVIPASFFSRQAECKIRNLQCGRRFCVCRCNARQLSARAGAVRTRL